MSLNKETSLEIVQEIKDAVDQILKDRGLFLAPLSFYDSDNVILVNLSVLTVNPEIVYKEYFEDNRPAGLSPGVKIGSVIEHKGSKLEILGRDPECNDFPIIARSNTNSQYFRLSVLFVNNFFTSQD